MPSFRKIGKWSLISLITILVIFIVTIEGAYYYGLRALPSDTSPTSAQFSDELKQMTWVSIERGEKIEMAESSPFKYLFSLFEVITSGDPVSIERYQGAFPPGIRLASMNARELLVRNRDKLATKHRGLSYPAVTIWVTQNWTVDQALNNILALSYYGNSFHGIEAAAKGYFGKSIDQLTINEMALIVGIEKSPVHYEPWCNPKRILQRQNYLLGQLMQYWPEKYSHLTKLNELPRTLVAKKCGQ